MPDLTEEEKKILRQAYEIKERIKAEELEAGEVSVDQAVEEEMDADMPLQRSRRPRRPQQGKPNSESRPRKPQKKEGFSLADDAGTEDEKKSLDERSIYGPEAAGKEIADVKSEDIKTQTTRTQTVSSQEPIKKSKSEKKNTKTDANLNSSKKRLDAQMKQVDQKWEQDKRKKQAGSTEKALEKTQKRQRRSEKPKKKKGFLHKLLKFFIILLIIVAVMLAGMYVFLRTTIAQTNYKPYETSYERQSDVLTQKGVTNILLIGTDTRVAGSNDARSDAMIVVSINPYKRRLVMTSIMRDSYVTIPGYGQNRINEAYSRGGPALLIQTIEENYKLGIDYYAQVDFFSFVDVIDAFGGVTINVEQPEVQWINGYIAEYNQVSGIPDRDGFVDEQFPGGEITLTGKQALGYARIRKIGNDFARTQRQRTVMNALLGNVKKANVVTIYKAVESILPDISTNISDSKMCSLLMQSILYLNFDMVQARVPADGTWSNAIMGENQEVLAVDFGANKTYLQSTIYD